MPETESDVDFPTENMTAPTEADLDTFSRQLGRPVRDVVAIGVRCSGCGAPLVAVTAPRLSNGIPFPTTFYLTHPTATAAVSRVEASGLMAEMTERIAQDPELAESYQKAHEQYLAAREQIGQLAGTGPVPEIDGISAGGMPTRVKCLHVLAAHSLTAGPGINTLGDEVLAAIEHEFSADVCRCEGAWDTTDQAPTKDLSRHVRRLAKAGMTNPIQHTRTSSLTDPVAAIDCGTNSIRLLIAQPDAEDPTRLSDLAREMRVVRLGEGVDATGKFSEAALERTFTAAEEYAELIASHQPENAEPMAVRFVATSASRDASNRDEFIAGIRQRLAVTPEVISGDEEASLSFTGAVSVLTDEQLTLIAERSGKTESVNVLVVDLGGGSTECVLGEITLPTADTAHEVTIRESISVDIGCVRLTERHLRSDPPTQHERDAAAQDVETILAQIQSGVPSLSEVDAVIGVAGTITTVTAAALELSTYDPERIHGASIPVEKINTTAEELLSATRAERTQLGFMHPGRVDVIGGGSFIWAALLNRLTEVTEGRIKTAFTSEHDILDGIAWSLISTPSTEETPHS